MRILLAAKHAPEGPRPIGGVQSWCRTVAAELCQRGHEVQMWGAEQSLPAGRFDLGIIANIADTRDAAGLCDQVVNVSHGIIKAEGPDRQFRCAFTSEGVRDYWQGAGAVIRQPIDTEFWFDSGRARSGLLRYSYRGGMPWLAGVAAEMGMTYTHISGVTAEEAREAMQGAACVLATGRAALEAAACGAPVVICDHRSTYQGPLIAVFGLTQARQNYSGREGFEPFPASAKGHIEFAMQEAGWRDYVRQHHDVRMIVNQLLEIAC